MPLVRFPVRNEYSLGHPELYKAANKEDPKAMLDGVAVAGLVGILRQLGDLAEFAAEVFHGLQEQVMTTASRSHKLMVRVQHIEAALPSLEKAVLAQTSHIHFAYTAGSEWHPRIGNEKNHFIYNDLPRFIMDSYEECRDPPHLHVLDKFDAGGLGSCLKRYSDPTFFKRVSGSSIEATVEKLHRDKKARKSKKKRSSQRNGELSRIASISSHSGRFHPTSQAGNGRTSSQTASTVDMTLKSDFGDHSNSFDSRTGLGYIECVFNPGSSLQPAEQESKKSTSSLMQHSDTLDSIYCDGSSQIVDDNFPCSSSQGQIAPSSSYVTWDEKVEIVEPKGLQHDRDEDPGVLSGDFDIGTWDRGTVNLGHVDQMDEGLEVLSGNFDRDSRDEGTTKLGNVDQMDILPSDEDIPRSIFNTNQLDEVESETDHYMDALNTIESESETDLDCQTKREVEQCSSHVINSKKEEGILKNDGKEGSVPGSVGHPSDHCPSNIESLTAYDVSPSCSVPPTLHNSSPSESIVFQQKPQFSGKSSASDHSPGTDVCLRAGTLDVSQAESVVIDGPQAESVSVDGPQSESVFVDGSQSESVVVFDSPQAESVVVVDGPQAESVFIHGSQSESVVVVDGPQAESVFIHGPQSESVVVVDGPQAESVVIDCAEAESVISDLPLSGSRLSDLEDQSGDKNKSSFNESQQPRAEFSGVQSVTFWTNGGLLGLEPSKPPAFAVSNAMGQDYVAKSKCETIGPPKPTFESDGQKGGPDTLVKGAENFVAVSSSSNEKVPLPLAYSDAKVEKFGGLQNSFNHGYEGNLNASAVAPSRTQLASDVKATSTEANRENDGNSSVVFGFGHRLLVNGFRRKLPLAHDEKSESVGSLLTGLLDRGSGHYSDANQTISKMTSIEQIDHGSPLVSLTSSPPLEHMKISFNPVDGLETSKLKLKFPDGTHCHESIRDMFASFQLVPEPAPVREYGSDSDDDTFCRSSPYISDDCLSHQSESNSEQWESDESPGGSKDHELYDALCRISSMETVSSSLQIEGTVKNGMHVDRGLQSMYVENGAEPCLSSLDLPSFDAMNCALQEETKSTSDLKNLRSSENGREETPLPPPLPPVEWRVSKPHSDVADNEPYNASESFKHAFDLKHLGSTIYQQPERVPIDELLTKRETIASNQEIKEENQKKFNSQKEAYQDANRKGLDEKEDFLHQIRSKSFSLRPTVTAKPTFTSGPATNVKVTAILEKANAIRQAVGSDDGEDDDTWSDT